ncbi:MAG: peptidase M61 [Sphingomonadaceae bacterium]|nr:peptidase M61 [Sphingomonadaceae bacterium]
MRRIGLAAFLLAAATAHASPGPQPVPMPPPIPTPQDQPYPGVLTLAVDATDTQRRIIRVRETIPVAGGQRATLAFPKWVPGGHSPRNPLKLIGGLTITGGGQRLAWMRDPVEVYAIHVDVPQGVTELALQFEYLSPTQGDEGAVSVAPNLLSVKWLQTAFYPAGYFARQIPIEPRITLPAGWDYATALDGGTRQGDTVSFARTSFETLVDSPLLAGRYLKTFELDTSGKSRVTLAAAADSAADLEPKPEQLEAHRKLIREADALYGARHYDHYTFLFWQSETLSGEGLEHHRSSENGVDPGYFRNWETGASRRSLLPHEYTHSWNGKFRRGADLWTPEYLTPMRDSLLWVYEGQTQYWGEVLAARSGLWSKDDALAALALTAATYGDNTPGRRWKALRDTTNDPIVQGRTANPWRSWMRSEDYYEEGKLIWFDADTLIREKTGGRKSLDDFARAFFGIEDGSYVPVTYSFDDVVRTLNGVYPMDWATWLRQRLDCTGCAAPLDGITRGGYKLVYYDTPTAYLKNAEARSKTVSLYGIGLSVGREARLTSVIWNSPAFQAGLTRGTKILAVNGQAYADDKLKDAVKATRTGTPLKLTVQDGDRVRDVTIAWDKGLQYPRLERIEGTPDRLSEIWTPKTGGAAARSTKGGTAAPRR